MPFHCPIMPQEHVFSWLNRIHLLFGHSKLKHTLAFLNVEDKPFKSGHHNQSSVDAIELYKREIVNDTSGFEVHSSLPLWSLTFDFSFFDSWKRRNTASVPSAYDAGNFAFQSNWKYCPHCVEKDIERCGHSFWHVKHQLPSVTHCYLHKTQLIDDAFLRDLRNKLIPQAHSFNAKKLEDEFALQNWSEFVTKVFDIVVKNPKAGEFLANQIRRYLKVPADLTYKDNEMFQPLQKKFDEDMPDSILCHLFLSYSKKRVRPHNLLKNTLGHRQTTRYNMNFSHPVCWLVILYWLKDKVSWDCCI